MASKLSELLKKVKVSYERHPVFGEVMSWRSLEQSLKRELPPLGAVLERSARWESTEKGVVVHVTVRIKLAEETAAADGMAFAPYEGRSGQDPVRAAMTAASRQALAFMLLAGADGEEEGGSDPEIYQPLDPSPNPTPPSRRDKNPRFPKPTQPSLSDTEDGERIYDALALSMRNLSQAGRANLIREIKSATGRGTLESLAPEVAKRLTRYLKDPVILRSYEAYVVAPQEQKEPYIKSFPWILGDEATVEEVAHEFSKEAQL